MANTQNSMNICEGTKTHKALSQLFKIDIDLGSLSYPVYVGAGLLDHAADFIDLSRAKRALIVCDSNTASLYSSQVAMSCEAHGILPKIVQFPAGEQSKTLKTLETLFAAASQHEISRDDIFIGLGGGVTTDLTGLCASLWQRGCKVVQIPTSLLSMVDASVGGKTAVDTEFGKNMVGTFWQPSCVICDVSCLKTLDDAYFYDACAEIIKHACIADPDLFLQLKNCPINPHTYTQDQLICLIARNIEIKRDFVVGDVRDRAKRQILNFGHTLGHSIEAASNYTKGHGACVGAGMAIITRAAVKAKLASPSFSSDLDQVLLAHNLPISCDIPSDILSSYAIRDKKASSTTSTCVVVEKPGNPCLVSIHKDQLKKILESGRAK